MKRIKSRIWDKETKSFQTDLRDITKFWSLAVSSEGVITKEMSELILYQESTGLMDIKSNEIFEGDIIKNHTGLLYMVTWLKGGYCARPLLNPSKCCALRDMERLEHCKIVGNICENDDLLTEFAKSFI